MKLPVVFAATLFAFHSTAFLILPDVGPDLQPLSGTPKAQNSQLSFLLKCAECPFPVIADDVQVWQDDSDSWMALNFTTYGNQLYVNDKEIFPLAENTEQLYTVLRRDPDGLESSPIPTGYVMELLKSQKFPADNNAELLSFHFTPIQVGGFPVPVGTITLPVIKSSNDDLFIVKGKAEASPPPQRSWRQCRRDPACFKDLLFARIRDVIQAAKARALLFSNKLSFKGCSGKPHHGNGSLEQHDGFQGHPHGEFNHDGSRRKGFAHGLVRTFAHALVRTTRLFIIPMILGLSAVLIAGAAGMAMGHIIASLWIRHRRSSNHPQNTDSEQGDAAEKEGLMITNDLDAPPLYEEEVNGEISHPADKQ